MDIKIFMLIVVISSFYYFTIFSKHDSKTIKNSNKLDKINENKQLIVRYQCDAGCGGFGDRLKGIVSAYAWSLITNRKLQIVLTHPCNMINVLKPNEIDWYVNDDELKQEKLLNKTQHYLYAIDNHNVREEMKKIDIRHYENKSDIIIIKNNLDWLFPFSINEKLQPRIKELGFDPKHFRIPYLFRTVFNKLFKLAPELQKRFDNFTKHAKPNGDKSKLICIQFRVWYSKRENSKRFWEFVNETFIKKLRKDESYKIFLTTERYNVEDEAIQVFGKENMVRNDGEYKHMDRGGKSGDNCTSIEKVLLDFYSQKLCDMAVISDSGFGKFGVWNRVDPSKNVYVFKHIVNGVFDFIRMDLDDDNIIL